ncbi:MAG: hypothetical protein NC253_13310 [Ruminococcus sp.]|nr:hypothetical protein [Ruminococcus sp.]MCM1381096.1 hypothetical protein [Muribaculaceae bacterium]MCM1478688.1 hypothetical protein [Muribaculaceae bacterium]
MKKILPLILSFMILCTLSACGKDEAVTVEPPESGWTRELLDKTIYINGVNYEYPAKWGDLKKRYTIGDDNSLMLFYKNKIAFLCSFIYEDSIDDNSEMDFVIFMNYEDEGSKIPSEELVSVNGLRLNDTYEDMTEKLGEPDDAYEDEAYRYGINTYEYFIDGETAVTIHFFASDRIEMITLKWNN